MQKFKTQFDGTAQSHEIIKYRVGIVDNEIVSTTICLLSCNNGKDMVKNLIQIIADSSLGYHKYS